MFIFHEKLKNGKSYRFHINEFSNHIIDFANSFSTDKLFANTRPCS